MSSPPGRLFSVLIWYVVTTGLLKLMFPTINNIMTEIIERANAPCFAADQFDVIISGNMVKRWLRMRKISNPRANIAK